MLRERGRGARRLTSAQARPRLDCRRHVQSELAEELIYDLPWQSGDVALIDNYVVMHGRRTFQGTRSVLAAFLQ